MDLPCNRGGQGTGKGRSSCADMRLIGRHCWRLRTTCKEVTPGRGAVLPVTLNCVLISPSSKS